MSKNLNNQKVICWCGEPMFWSNIYYQYFCPKVCSHGQRTKRRSGDTG